MARLTPDFITFLHHHIARILYIQLMSDGMRRELVYLSSYATNRYFIPNWGIISIRIKFLVVNPKRTSMTLR